MKDEILHEVFMSLIRAGLWNQPPETDHYPIADADWLKIRKTGKKQTVSGILYDGMLLLPDEFQPPANILISWTAEIDSLERKNRRMNEVLAELHALFTKAGIDLTLQKGQGLAALYEHPEHRVCGDIDWNIPCAADREKALWLLRRQGVRVEGQAGNSVLYCYKGIIVEHHKHSVDIHNPFVRGFIRELIDREHKLARSLSLHGEVVTLPSVLLTHLQVNMHILKHMLSFGIGLRQLCDTARLYYSLHDMTDGLALKQIYKKTGTYRWIQVFHELLVKELGLSSEYLPFERAPGVNYGWMMNDVVRGGNFGFYDSDAADATRQGTSRRWMWIHRTGRFLRYLQLTPQEAFWFPVSHVYSHLQKEKSDPTHVSATTKQSDMKN